MVEKHAIRKRPGKIIKKAIMNFFRKPATIPYPNGKLYIVNNYRGRLVYNSTNCTGCGLCVRDCPAGAIKIKNEGTKEDKDMKAMLNVGRCVFCCQCVDSCPKKCLSYSQKIDLSSLNKVDFKVTL